MHLIRSHGLVHLQVPLDGLEPDLLLLGGSSFSQALPLPSVTWAVWLEHLPVKTEAKKSEHLSLLHILGNQVSLFLLERAHIFPSLPFIADVPIEAFLVALDVPGQI